MPDPTVDDSAAAFAELRAPGRVELSVVGASAFEIWMASGAGGGPRRLDAIILMICCQVWSGDFGIDLAQPFAPEGSAEFAAELLDQMAEKAPAESLVMQADTLGMSFAELARLCRSSASDNAVGEQAFSAGLNFGRAIYGGANIAGDSRAFSTGAKALDGQLRRVEQVRQRRRELEERLFAFAATEIAADPFVKNAALERKFRHLENKTSGPSSNNLSRILARFRNEGRLPKTMKVGLVHGSQDS